MAPTAVVSQQFVPEWQTEDGGLTGRHTVGQGTTMSISNINRLRATMAGIARVVGAGHVVRAR